MRSNPPPRPMEEPRPIPTERGQGRPVKCYWGDAVAFIRDGHGLTFIECPHRNRWVWVPAGFGGRLRGEWVQTARVPFLCGCPLPPPRP